MSSKFGVVERVGVRWVYDVVRNRKKVIKFTIILKINKKSNRLYIFRVN